MPKIGFQLSSTQTKFSPLKVGDPIDSLIPHFTASKWRFWYQKKDHTVIAPVKGLWNDYTFDDMNKNILNFFFTTPIRSFKSLQLLNGMCYDFHDLNVLLKMKRLYKFGCKQLSLNWYTVTQHSEKKSAKNEKSSVPIILIYKHLSFYCNRTRAVQVHFQILYYNCCIFICFGCWVLNLAKIIMLFLIVSIL